ncbi:hypothetical protein E2C01_036694 [Portunus trituberculatus]|uniref:Uncharacterized protein n=1 Tax=Portunus trituberculatus TaxID=210409 RepID=A0A5B7FDC8_PORTR|nr:hypothetical protein [Portunus trituberculatus]
MYLECSTGWQGSATHRTRRRWLSRRLHVGEAVSHQAAAGPELLEAHTAPCWSPAALPLPFTLTLLPILLRAAPPALAGLPCLPVLSSRLQRGIKDQHEGVIWVAAAVHPHTPPLEQLTDREWCVCHGGCWGWGEAGGRGDPVPSLLLLLLAVCLALCLQVTVWLKDHVTLHTEELHCP